MVALPVQHWIVRPVPGWQDRGSLVGDPLRPSKAPAAVDERSYGDLGDAQRQAKRAKEEVWFDRFAVCVCVFARVCAKTCANIEKKLFSSFLKINLP